MDLSAVFSKTSKGSRALAVKSKALSSDAVKILAKINGKLTGKLLLTEVGGFTEIQFKQVLSQLLNDGYINVVNDFDETDFFSSHTIHPMVVEEIITSKFFDTEFNSSRSGNQEDNFPIPKNKEEANKIAKARAEAELNKESETIALVQAAIQAKLKSEVETINKREMDAKAEAERKARETAVAQARAKAQAEAERKAREEAEAKARAEAERKAREEAEAKARAEAERKAREEAEAKARAEAERKAREEAEAKAKAEAERKAREEAEAKAREEAERKAREEAEAKARAEAERKAREEAEAKARAEAERKAREEAEAKARAEAERKAREEAEAKAKAEAERKAREEAEAKARAEAERKAREEAEAKAKAEAERKAREEAEAKAKAEAERKAREEAEAKARAEAERKAREEAEAKARAEAERKAREEAEAKAKAEAERKAREEAEAKARAEAERKAREEAEAKAKAEAERKAREEAEAKARAEAERKAREEAEAKAKAEAERKAREEAEAKAKAEAERKAREEAEAKAKAEAERKAREEAEAKAKAEAERKAREEAEAKAKAEAERKAREEAEAKAKAEAERKAREEAKAKADKEMANASLIETVTTNTLPLGASTTTTNTEVFTQAELEVKAKIEDEIRKIKSLDSPQTENTTLSSHNKNKESFDEGDFLLDDDEAFIDEDEDIKQEVWEKESETLAAEIQARETKKYHFQPAKKINFNFGKRLSYVVAMTSRLLVPLAVGSFLLILVTFALTNIPFFMSPFIGSVENIASKSIGERVSIQKLSTSLWPEPKLVLDGVKIGQSSDLEVGSIKVAPDLSSLLDERVRLNYIEFDHFSIQQESLNRLNKWLESTTKSHQLQNQQIFFKQANIVVRNMTSPTFDAEIQLDNQGKIALANIDSSNNIIAQVKNIGNQYNLIINAKRLALPFGEPLVLNELEAIGTIDQNQLTLNNIESHLYKGDFKAKLNIDWSNTLHAKGEFTATDIEFDEIVPNFSPYLKGKGSLTATATFSSDGTDIVRLFDNPEINANFKITRGEIQWIDIIRGIQRKKEKAAVGGITSFDDLNGQLVLKNHNYQYNKLTLTAGKLIADGDITISENYDLSGKVKVNLSTETRKVASTLNLTGKATSPISK